MRRKEPIIIDLYGWEYKVEIRNNRLTIIDYLSDPSYPDTATVKLPYKLTAKADLEEIEEAVYEHLPELVSQLKDPPVDLYRAVVGDGAIRFYKGSKEELIRDVQELLTAFGFLIPPPDYCCSVMVYPDRMESYDEECLPLLSNAEISCLLDVILSKYSFDGYTLEYNDGNYNRMSGYYKKQAYVEVPLPENITNMDIYKAQKKLGISADS
ncbi:MAG: hypothetical protein D6698_17380 [Gammaproteobacteria bacterium]|nr:MAG: hypothetical protein D6698_17380 [Gammaproteobacteria bacterium]